MNALVWISLGLAIASLGVSALALMVSLRRPLPALQVDPTPSLPEPEPSPLEGLTVALAISQDHAHPVFVNLLTEILRKLDAEVTTIPPEGPADWDGDLLISGTVTCNGYAEVYYKAELTCATRSETICTFVDNPASGDRQSNLAQELVSKIETEIAKRLSRTERRLALRELNDDSR